MLGVCTRHRNMPPRRAVSFVVARQARAHLPKWAAEMRSEKGFGGYCGGGGEHERRRQARDAVPYANRCTVCRRPLWTLKYVYLHNGSS